MTTQQTTLPSPVSPYAPSWALYVYGTHAFFTYNGRLIAWASVATPTQEARIKGVLHRLTVQTAPQGSTHS